eukprot:TRINITY_DN12367_c0_g1_i1.p1 TRINITY_DN12367_c0_g1~~TRINITY_DN12367_c0_g1_i1.p1  ORF type:complete len:713 (-),score=92.65 TRINITY_DN12367_c0_g1_i1:298-2436(-)
MAKSDIKTHIITRASYVLCCLDYIEYALEGHHKKVRYVLGEDTAKALLAVRGTVYNPSGTAQSLTWQSVATHLATLEPDSSVFRRYFSSLRGSFWVAYARLHPESGRLCLLTASDPVGTFPMWLGVGAESNSCLASPNWPSTQLQLQHPHTVTPLRQSCPRISHFWSSDSGLSSSMPDAFYGLHSESPSTEAPINQSAERDSTDVLQFLLLQAVRRCLPEGCEHVGLLFSGGLDSGLLGWLFAGDKLGSRCRCTCYTVGFHMTDKNKKYAYPEDLAAAQSAAAEMKLDWRPHVMDIQEAETLIHDCARVVADFNTVKASVGITMLAACQLAAKDGITIVLSGLGSEEAFAGYCRHARALGAGDEATERDRTLGLAQMWHRDLQRDFAVAALAGVEIRYPFLDGDLLAMALCLPAAPLPPPGVTYREAVAANHGSQQEDLTADGGKGALRAVARRLGTPAIVAERRKRAAQYGSRVYNAVKILSNAASKRQDDGNTFVQANYVMSLPGASHSTLALVFTSGYHSVHAYRLHRSWDGKFACVIPPEFAQDEATTRDNLATARAFAASEGLPILGLPAVRNEEGYDLSSLVAALSAARDEFGIGGVACGHVCNLELWGGLAAACDIAGLRAYAPHWGGTPNSSTMARIVNEDTVLAIKKFPDPTWIGRRISTSGQAEDMLLALQALKGVTATDDFDAGFVDCSFVKCNLLAEPSI